MGILYFQPLMWSLLMDSYRMRFLSSFIFTFGAHLLQPTKKGHKKCIMGVIRTQSHSKFFNNGARGMHLDILSGKLCNFYCQLQITWLSQTRTSQDVLT